jgi:hypothetical protein
MPNNQYSAQEALQLLMRKLRGQDPELAAEVQAAIDAGKDVSETKPIPGRRKGHIYRRTVPFSHEEALQVAMDALQAYFVEQPMFVDAAADNLAQSAIGVPANDRSVAQVNRQQDEPLSLEGRGLEKAIEIEIQTETQISRTGDETLPLKRVPKQLIEEQHQQIIHLRDLLDFKEA